jgi:hypothetical protein
VAAARPGRTPSSACAPTLALPRARSPPHQQGLDARADRTDTIGELIADGQDGLAERWAASLGRDYQAAFVEACVALDKLKPAARAVRALGLQEQFPDVEVRLAWGLFAPWGARVGDGVGVGAGVGGGWCLGKHALFAAQIYRVRLCGWSIQPTAHVNVNKPYAHRQTHTLDNPLQGMYRLQSLRRLIDRHLWSVALSFVGQDQKLQVRPASTKAPQKAVSWCKVGEPTPARMALKCPSSNAPQTLLLQEMLSAGEAALASDFQQQLGLPEAALAIDPASIAEAEARRRGAHLPLSLPPGAVVVLDEPSQLAAAREALAGSPTIGIDLEWQPSHATGRATPAALLQVRPAPLFR